MRHVETVERHGLTRLRDVLILVVIAVLGAPALVLGQWVHYPTAGLPRKADGTANLTAPAPRLADGKPDFSGMWFTDDALPCPPASGNPFLECGVELGLSRYGLNIGQGVKGGLPYKPETQALVRKRSSENSKDDPHARCMPEIGVGQDPQRSGDALQGRADADEPLR